MLLTVGGIDVSESWLVPRSKLTDRVGAQLTQFRFVLDDLNNDLELDDLQEVALYESSGGVKMFGGIITNVTFEEVGIHRTATCVAADFGWLLKTVLVTRVYAAGMADSAIIVHLLGQYMPDFGSTDVVTVNADMPTMNFNRVTLETALLDILRITGATFYVDHSRGVHYSGAAAELAPFALSETPDDGFEKGVQYQVRYRAQGASSWEEQPIQNALYAVLPNLESGTMYDVQVRSHDSRGESNWSNTATANTD